MTTKAKVFLSMEERKWRKQFRRKLKDKIESIIKRRYDAEQMGDGITGQLVGIIDDQVIEKVMDEIMDYREIVSDAIKNPSSSFDSGEIWNSCSCSFCRNQRSKTPTEVFTGETRVNP